MSTAPLILPATLDYRPQMPPVRNQGKQGACIAEAAVCAVEWLKRSVLSQQRLSPQFVFDMGGGSTLAGMTFTDALDVLCQFGVCRQVTCPYGTASDGRADVPAAAIEEAARYRLASFDGTSITRDASGVNKLRAALVQSGPCPILFPTYNTSATPWIARRGETILGFHGMCVVGYTTGAFIVRNSWGKHWADGGDTTFSFSDWGLQDSVFVLTDLPSLFYYYAPTSSSGTRKSKCKCCSGGRCVVC